MIKKASASSAVVASPVESSLKLNHHNHPFPIKHKKVTLRNWWIKSTKAEEIPSTRCSLWQ